VPAKRKLKPAPPKPRFPLYKSPRRGAETGSRRGPGGGARRKMLAMRNVSPARIESSALPNEIKIETGPTIA
jgi:hypothetical protein